MRIARRVEVVLKVVFRVEHLVAEEFIRRAVQGVRTRPHHHDELGAGVSAVLGRIAAGENLDFLHRFGGRRPGHRVYASLRGHHAVQRRMLIHLTLTIGH